MINDVDAWRNSLRRCTGFVYDLQNPGLMAGRPASVFSLSMMAAFAFSAVLPLLASQVPLSGAQSTDVNCSASAEGSAYTAEFQYQGCRITESR